MSNIRLSEHINIAGLHCLAEWLSLSPIAIPNTQAARAYSLEALFRIATRLQALFTQEDGSTYSFTYYTQGQRRHNGASGK